MEIDYSDHAAIAIQNTTPNAGCTIDGKFYDVRNLLATIARLSAERDQARAEAAAAYERAAQVADEIAKDYDVMEPGKPDVYANAKTQRAAKGMVRMARDDIRALATEAETTALAEMLDAETRACAQIVRDNGMSSMAGEKAILARLDQRKEEGSDA